MLIPTGRTKNEGLNEGLGCVSYANLQVLRCHPCTCKFFCISFPLTHNPKVGGSNPPPATKEIITIGTKEQYRNESLARKAVQALLLNLNAETPRAELEIVLFFSRKLPY